MVSRMPLSVAHGIMANFLVPSKQVDRLQLFVHIAAALRISTANGMADDIANVFLKQWEIRLSL